MGVYDYANHNKEGNYGSFEVAHRTYRYKDNCLVASARGSLLSGMILILITAIILFELNWIYFKLAIIILAGIGVLGCAVLPGKERVAIGTSYKEKTSEPPLSAACRHFKI